MRYVISTSYLTCGPLDFSACRYKKVMKDLDSMSGGGRDVGRPVADNTTEEQRRCRLVAELLVGDTLQ